MDREELLKDVGSKKVLFGLFFSFANRLQAVGDTFYDEITCKQFFALICLSLFQDNDPTINELSEVMGSSHQNVKQIISKLENKGFVKVYKDELDKRKQRVCITEKLKNLELKYNEKEKEFMNQLYEGISIHDVETTIRVIKTMEDNLK